MAETAEKLTKKQKKALEFRNKKKDVEVPEATDGSKKRSREQESKEHQDVTGTDGEAPKKKRKTRRGKKGKGQNGAAGGPRFLLFVGNLPYDISETELHGHFSAAQPDRIRIRTDKGIAFLEFDSTHTDIQHKMEVALRMHHSTLRNRKINVELTVGGGGNSKERLEKIKDKNTKMDVERKQKIEKKKKEVKAKKDQKKEIDLTGVHPDRAKLLMR